MFTASFMPARYVNNYLVLYTIFDAGAFIKK